MEDDDDSLTISDGKLKRASTALQFYQKEVFKQIRTDLQVSLRVVCEKDSPLLVDGQASLMSHKGFFKQLHK